MNSGKARFINHRRKHENLKLVVTWIDEIPRVTLFALKKIHRGEFLSYDYGERDPIRIKANPWLKVNREGN